MESLDTAGWIIDDLLDFSSDIGEENENKNNIPNNKALTSSLPLDSKPLKDEALTTIFDPDKETPFLPHSEVIQEEELEWLSNENAFPPIETFIPMKPNIELKHQSPISIKLETSTISSSSISCSSSSSSGTLSSNITLGVPVPVQARSKRRRRKRNYLEYSGHKWRLFRSAPEKRQEKRIAKVSDGRKCTHCLSEKTPQWRAGPMGPKTLCNACGVRYKSGRLVPEYRPASSPTFVTEVHSNSHRKIMEMRKHKEKPSSLSVDNG